MKELEKTSFKPKVVSLASRTHLCKFRTEEVKDGKINTYELQKLCGKKRTDEECGLDRSFEFKERPELPELPDIENLLEHSLTFG